MMAARERGPHLHLRRLGPGSRPVAPPGRDLPAHDPAVPRPRRPEATVARPRPRLRAGRHDGAAAGQETLRPDRLVGVDSSASFLDQARAAVPDAEFEQRDLVVDDLPPADAVYARYLLSHLPEPEARVAAWQRALRPGGRLLLEENTRLRIHHPVFRRYEDAVAVVMGSGGGDLYVGERLVPLADRVTITTVRPPASVIARLFGMNLVTWGRNPAAAGLDVESLAADLQSLETSEELGLVEFELAQLALDATSSA
jgi:SAM-dependent methyltransferase